MAIELQEGVYALQQDTSKKTVLHLKLTDSALRAIELYQDELRKHRVKPSIRFDGNQGVIQIPSNDVNEPQNFTFQLAALNQSAAIDCLQQYSTSDSMGHVAVLGGIQQKITVNAKDDSYNATKKRMEIVKEQEKNISTKVIKQPSSKITKKKPLRRQLLDPKQSNSYSHGRNSTPPRTNHSFSRSVSPLTSSSSHRSASPGFSGNDLPGVRNKTKPVLSSISSSTSSPSHSSVARPLQERVMHYLAVRPTKLPDLLARLSRGASPPEKTTLQDILQQIATSRVIRPGVFEYSLNKNLYNEISSDWTGYTDDERASLKRRQAEIILRGGMKRPIASPDDKAKTSPNSNALSSLEETYSNPIKKKMRVSRVYNDKTSPHSRPRSVSPLEGNGPALPESSSSKSYLSSSTIVPLNDSNMGGLTMGQTTTPRRYSPKRPSSANSRSGKVNHSPEKQPSPKKVPPLSESFTPSSSTLSSTVNSKSSNREAKGGSPNVPLSSSSFRTNDPESNRQQREESEASTSSRENTRNARINHSIHDEIPSLGFSFSLPPSEKDSFVKKYPPITNSSERDEYRAAFYSEYKEYLALFQKVYDKAKRFSQWQIELEQSEMNTDQYKSIALQVYDEYNRLQSDSVFQEDRRTLQHLHRKLKYIKQLVFDFDCRQMEQGSQEPRDPDNRPNPHRRSNNVAQKRPLLTA